MKKTSRNQTDTGTLTEHEQVRLPVRVTPPNSDRENSFHDRVAILVTVAGGVKDFARLCDVSESVVRKWKSGASDPKREHLVRMANMVGASVDWLATGRGPIEAATANHSQHLKLRAALRIEERGEHLIYMGDDSESERQALLEYRARPEPAFDVGEMSRVPVVGTTQAGPPDRIWEEYGYPVGHGDGEIEAYTSDRNAYALRVEGDSMAPRLLAGEFVLVSPNRESTTGEEVVVRTIAGECMVKVLAKIDDNEIILTSHNEHYARRIIPLVEVDIIHPIVATYRRSSLRRT